MSNPIDPLTGKPKRGRPNHDPKNQYTGVKAKNIDWVRQYVRQFLESERNLPQPNEATIEAQPRGYKHENAAAYYKMIVWSCRLLLACEGIYFLSSPPLNAKKKAKAQKRLSELAKGVKDGTVTLPQLLDQIDEIESQASHEVEEPENAEVQLRK